MMMKSYHVVKIINQRTVRVLREEWDIYLKSDLSLIPYTETQSYKNYKSKHGAFEEQEEDPYCQVIWHINPENRHSYDNEGDLSFFCRKDGCLIVDLYNNTKPVKQKLKAVLNQLGAIAISKGFQEGSKTWKEVVLPD